jgi:pyruvate/2-oxoglutarate dehydrogenase complex dihydrolipoamide dehydrogenase (E3) component
VTERYDLVVLGAGSAGLTGAAFAAKLGARVALVEARRVGGDCTWTGCIPSKALIKVARIAHDVRRAAEMGLAEAAPAADMRRVREWIRSAVADVYSRETPRLLTADGIEVIDHAAEFVDAHTVRAGDRVLRARRFVIATGARPAIPSVAGLADVPYVTHEAIFDVDRLPAHLVVLGAGPIGVEIAQAYRRLGAAVTVVGETLLPREDGEARAALLRVLLDEGVRVVSGRAVGARRFGAEVELDTSAGSVRGDLLLVAAGRQPNVAGLALDRAGVLHDATGIRVDRWLRTSVPHVYAAGDVTGGPQFTHYAAWQCFRAVRNALLPGRAPGMTDVVPRVTFTDPELAHVGTTEDEARAARRGRIVVHHMPLRVADRAVCDGERSGFVKVVATPRGRILGATVVASRAGEMIGEFAIAMEHGLRVRALASTIHAYPTWSSALQQVESRAAVDGFLASIPGRMALRWGWLRGGR